MLLTVLGILFGMSFILLLFITSVKRGKRQRQAQIREDADRWERQYKLNVDNARRSIRSASFIPEPHRRTQQDEQNDAAALMMMQSQVLSSQPDLQGDVIAPQAYHTATVADHASVSHDAPSASCDHGSSYGGDSYGGADCGSGSGSGSGSDF